MNEGHRLHEAHVEGVVEPAGAFTIEMHPGPDGVAAMSSSPLSSTTATPAGPGCSSIVNAPAGSTAPSTCASCKR